MSFTGRMDGRLGGLVLPALLALLIPVSLMAQVAEGKIEGYVRDKDTGAPLAGAQVVVEGTNLGNITNQDGYYFILNVLPGLRTITARYTGYQTTSVENQRIAAGYTATVNISLSSTIISIEGITISGEASPLIQRDNVQTRQNITLEEAAEVPYEDLNSIIGLQAGVRQQGDYGFTIRGGRQNEEAVYVDGVLVRNFSTGLNNQSTVESSTWLKVAPDAIEEVSIITGGFQAEYGNAQSGVVNIVTRGGDEKIAGSLYYKTDEVLPEENRYGFNMMRANVGGPFPIPNSRFFLSTELRGQLDASPRRGEEYGRFVGITPRFYNGFNALLGGYLTDNGITLNDMPKFNLPKRGARIGVERDEYIVSGKFNLPLGERVTTIWTYNQSRIQNMNFSVKNNLLNMPGRTAFLNKTRNGLFGFDWDIAKSAQSSYSLRLRASAYENELHTGPIDPRWADRDGSSLGQVDFRTGELIEERGTFLNFAFSDYKMLYGDVYTKGDVPAERDPWTANELAAHRGNPYWGWGSQVVGGTSTQVLNQRERNAAIKLDLDAQINRYNRAKVGLDIKVISLGNLNLSQFSGFAGANTQNYYQTHPSLISAYVQDRIDIGDLVVDVGLRWDRMNPRATFPVEAGGGPDMPQVQAPVRNVFSPRVGVAHPVTDRTQFRFSYGQFYQPPAFDLMYAGKNVQNDFIWSVVGDKDLDYSKTTAFEVGFTSLLNDNLVLDVVGYYRDFEGNIAVRYWEPSWFSAPMPFFTNQDYGNSKGIDVTLKRRMVRYLALTVSYSLQAARGTGGRPEFQPRPGQQVNPVTGEYIEPPVRFYPLDNDRTHSLNVQANVLLPNDFKAGTKLGAVLRNTSYYLILGATSGGFAGIRTPESVLNVGSNFTDFRSLRGISNKITHLRAAKRFLVGKGRSISVFTEIRNLIQWNARKGFFPASTSQLTQIRREFSTGDGVKFPQLIGSYTADPIPDYENDPQATDIAALRDYNNDGSISRAEQFVAERMNQAILDGWNAGGTARLVRFGLELTF